MNSTADQAQDPSRSPAELPSTRKDSLSHSSSEQSLPTSDMNKVHDAAHDGLVEEGLVGEEHYQLYRRRFVGLAQLTLVVTIAQLDAGVYSAVTRYAAEYFDVSVLTINWLSTAFSLAFIPPCPLVIWALNKSGPKLSIVIASVLLIVGNWIRYAGTVTRNFPTVMVGHILLAFANAFVLPAPTRYSQLWFSKKGRTSATGVATLASAIGSAVGGFIANPMLEALGMSNYVLVITAISTAVCIPSFFIPAKPPTPPSAAAALPKLDLRQTFRALSRNKPFYLMFINFSIFVAAFQSSTTIISTAVIPYPGLTQTNAALAGAILVVAGLVAAAIVSPLLDRTGSHLRVVKFATPLIASSYLALAFIPQTQSVAGLYVVFAWMGAASFAVTPGTLEFQAAWTFPASPEVSSILCWAGGQAMTAVMIEVMGALTNPRPMWGQPTGSEFRGLVFQAVLVWAVVPLTMLTGHGIFRKPAGALADM